MKVIDPLRAGRSQDSSSEGSEDRQHVFLTALEVTARYGWGRTKGYRILRSGGFPRPIGGDRYRLDSLIGWENMQLTAPRPRTKPTVLPARKRRAASPA